ncbi:hypothetical protein H696_00446 [Fonticula alba]|uniref:Tropomyosin n=1 Tax=Fonticula alba TaxID=691883 RepID=A0A058ZEP0_FONAL|nr:hypothetical protein H696_00446 [Fonticula alba]KCV72875.1 hypothetical protein H696_00446 [Fonticula alba]|eukprot:XP_009492576.1 hypothetical protein H696_00446 [Fonticula alba]
MDKVRERIEKLKLDVDDAVERAEIAEEKYREATEKVRTLENENKVLLSKIALLEQDLDRAEERIHDMNETIGKNDDDKRANSGLLNKISLLERDLETAEDNLRDKTEQFQAAEHRADENERRLRILDGEREALERELDQKIEENAKLKAELKEFNDSLLLL